MDEQVQTELKVKKPGILRRVLWWVWMILLLLLLAAGLFLAAPWKVITLITIFLAAATILPRIYRKGFWFGVGVIVIALLVWIFLPEDNEAWRPYTFDKEAAQLQAKYAVPDSENAAVIYNEIYKTWKEKEPNEPNRPNKNDLTTWRWLQSYGRDLWLSKDHPETAAWLDYHKNTIDRLIEASEYEKCLFPENFTEITQSSDSDEGPVLKMFDWVNMLIASANNDLAEKRRNEAVEKYIAALKIGNQLRNQPNWHVCGFGGIYEMYALKALNSFIINDSEGKIYLDEIEEAIKNLKNDFHKNLSAHIEIDKLQVKNILAGGFYQVNSNGRARITRDPWAQDREYIKNNWDFYDKYVYRNGKRLTDIANPGYKAKTFAKTCSIHYWFLVPQSVNNFSKIIDKNFEIYNAMLNSSFDWKQKTKIGKSSFKLNISDWIDINVRINESSYYLMHKLFHSYLADQKGSQLIINLRRYKDEHGKWPEMLDKIEDTNIDPLAKEAFVYKKEGDNFILYSKGLNNIDDQGKHEETVTKPERKTINKGCDDRMIWPIKRQTSEQQEEDVNDSRQ